MIATVTGWFETRRNLAVSLVSAGMGMAPLTISPFASWLITHYGWRAAMFYVGVLAWVAGDSGRAVRAAAAGRAPRTAEAIDAPRNPTRPRSARR